jgi:hypothetical protein
MRFAALAVLCSLALSVSCSREGSGGPAEKAGRNVDRAMGKAGEAVEQAGRDMQDASKGKK